MREALPKHTEAAAALMAAIDKDEDGTVGLNELRGASPPVPPPCPPPLPRGLRAEYLSPHAPPCM